MRDDSQKSKCSGDAVNGDAYGQLRGVLVDLGQAEVQSLVAEYRALSMIFTCAEL